MKTGGQQDNAAAWKNTAGCQKGIDPQYDGGGHGLTQEIHAQGKVLKGKKQKDAQPWSLGIAADPDKNQRGQQEVKDKKKGAVITVQEGDDQVQQEIPRL